MRRWALPSRLAWLPSWRCGGGIRAPPLWRPHTQACVLRWVVVMGGAARGTWTRVACAVLVAGGSRPAGRIVRIPVTRSGAIPAGLTSGQHASRCCPWSCFKTRMDATWWAGECASGKRGARVAGLAVSAAGGTRRPSLVRALPVGARSESTKPVRRRAGMQKAHRLALWALTSSGGTYPQIARPVWRGSRPRAGLLCGCCGRYS